MGDLQKARVAFFSSSKLAADLRRFHADQKSDQRLSAESAAKGYLRPQRRDQTFIVTIKQGAAR
jgi:hypothetical protein